MICWRCGAEIPNGSKDCLICSTSQIRDKTKTALGGKLRALYDNCGAQKLLSGSGYSFVNGIGDFVENPQKLQTIVKSALRAGIGDKYLYQIEQFGSPNDTFYNQVKIILVKSAGLNENDAKLLMEYFDEMIGWKKESPKPTPTPDPVPKPKPTPTPDPVPKPKPTPTTGQTPKPKPSFVYQLFKPVFLGVCILLFVLLGYIVIISFKKAPFKVTGLKARATGREEVTLSWSTLKDAEGYIILRDGNQIGYVIKQSSYVDTAASPDHMNYYWVIPFSHSKNGIKKGKISDYAWAIGWTVAPAGTVATEISPGVITLRWDAIEGASSYVILSKTGTVEAPFDQPHYSSVTEFSDNISTASGTIMYYWVYGIYTNSEGGVLTAGKASPFAWAVTK